MLIESWLSFFPPFPDLDREQVKIRVVVCTSGGLSGSLILQQFIDCPQMEVVGVVLSDKLYSSKLTFWQGLCRLIERSGIFYALYVFLVVNVAEVLGFYRDDCYGSTSAMSKKHGIPLHRTVDINSTEGHQFLSSISPHLLISSFFDQVFKADLCDGELYSVVNIHPGLLPFNKGIDPVFQDVLNGSDHVGVTVHRLTAKLDAGKILGQKKVSRSKDISVIGLEKQLARIGAEVVIDNLPLLLDCTSGYEQTAKGKMIFYPYREEVCTFYKQGGHLYRWSDFIMP